ncbi:MAG TPA: hypothetical protein VM658_08690, partial [bacterium]|nr:hypothetical protein [bacterium]
MRTYLERFRFKHPKTADFIAVANEVAGQDLGWFFTPMLYTNETLDYSVSYVSTEKVAAGKGYDYTLGPDGGGMTDGAGNGEMYESVVKVRRLGGFQFPVEVEMWFADGETVRESWDGQDTWIEYRCLKPAKLIKAVADPDRKITADLNYKNNEMKTGKKTRQPGGLYSPGTIKYLLDPY